MSTTTPTVPTGSKASSSSMIRSVCEERDAGGGGVTVVSLCGELDLLTALPLLSSLLRLQVPRAGKLVLDLSDVTFCDSAGFNLFLRLNRRMRAGTELQLRGITRQPARVLRLLGLPSIVSCDFASQAPR